MAKKIRQETAAPVVQTPIAQAKAALARGDVRRARKLAAEAARAASEAERGEARALLERTRPDPQSLLAVGAVLALILVALWAAILRLR